MLETLRRKREEEGGFTLIELLLVIVILGVLAAVVVLSVRGISDRGESAACGATRTATLTALEARYAQDGSYPTALDQLVPNFLTEGSGVSVGATSIAPDGDTPAWTLTYAFTAGPPQSYTLTECPA